MSFAARCGIDSPARRAAAAQAARLIEASGIEQVRFSWCDQHGALRGKTLMPQGAIKSMDEGVGLVSTLLLKDTSDRTCWKVFEAGGVADLPGFEAAPNLLLLPDLASYRQLPWARKTAWFQCQPWFQDGRPVALDTRRVLQTALARLQAQGLAMQCGLEVEFHIYRINPAAGAQGQDPLDPEHAAWPGLPPPVSMIHSGYNLLSEAWGDQCHAPLQIVQQTAQALGLPLLSLEIELGPSQVEAVFGVTDALAAADNMVLFRSAVTQALRRAGYLATFMCRPPFPNIMSSGWHLHQSLVQLPVSRQSLADIKNDSNAFMRGAPAEGTSPRDAQFTLSGIGDQYLAGLLDHATGMAALAVPTVNGFERFSANRLAPNAINWGRDNRGAMLRVIGQAGDPSTRIENRVGEPAANPYLYIASQIHAGLDGITRQLKSPPASDSPYDGTRPRLPASLGEAVTALRADSALAQGLGLEFVNYYTHIKQAEIARFEAAQDKLDWQRREYFSRI